MATYKELLAQQDALARQIEEARVNEVSSAIEQVKKLVEDYALTASDIFAPTSKTRATKGKLKGSTVAPKYRDPITGTTWTGRGLAPKWLQGKNKEDFLI